MAVLNSAGLDLVAITSQPVGSTKEVTDSKQ